MILQRALQQVEQILFAERPQFENLRARNQRRIDKEKWIVRGRADQSDDAAFHIRQQNVLLRFVEAMDFVDEQNRGLAGVFQAIGRGGQNAAHVGDIRFHAAEPLEFAFGLARDDLGERSFAGARAGRKRSAIGCDRLRWRGAAVGPGPECVFGRRTR